jgi:hypothetical protein
MARHIIKLGKADWHGVGRQTHPCTLELSWDGSSFTACASVWLPSRRDITAIGQILEEVCALFPKDKRAQRVLAIWRDWHLNDMTAGSPAQEAWLKANPVSAVYPESHFTKAREALARAGLNPDPSYMHNREQPYSYGSAWLKRDIPADVVAEIEDLMKA